MPLEIERKFLVKGNFKSAANESIVIIQGYLSSSPERTVRVRTWDKKAFLTIKGKTNSTGTSRFEWEKEIPHEEALELLKICEPGIIHKTRFIVTIREKLAFEVDEFYDENEGLIMAEIEVPNEDFPFEKPDWLGEEVTNDKRFYNSYLAKHPFKTW